MCRICLILGALLAAVVAAIGGGTPTVVPPTEAARLRSWLAEHLSRPRFVHAQWGVMIVSLDTGLEWFATNEARLFVPASNTKLFTGALALDTLGPEFRARTSLYASAPPDRKGRLRGDLVVYGRGDPTIAARFQDDDLRRAFAPLVDAVVRAGVRRVDGALLADDSFFRGGAYGSGWDWDDLEYYYGAPVSALSVNENALTVKAVPGPATGLPAVISLDPPCSSVQVSNRVLTVSANGPTALTLLRPLGSEWVLADGSIAVGRTSVTETVSVPTPARWFVEVLGGELQQRGVKIRRGTRAVPHDFPFASPTDVTQWFEVAAVESPQLAEMLPLMMKPSQNLHAQMLLLQCGVVWERAAPVGTSFSTTERAGLAALTNFVARIGITAGEVMFEEGTGLSRRNLVSPRAIVQLLRYMDAHPQAALFRESLPVAGRDGTLRTRLRGTPAAGNAQAKTGYVAFTYTLSGYVTTQAGERLAFALLLNNYQTPDPDRPARMELDDIVAALAGIQTPLPSRH
jgi:D-alanyl-D-alanine carboxypeptidase/D-alanyl-D-alanine-endopeptidase (penicillin-binding protein 4)